MKQRITPLNEELSFFLECNCISKCGLLQFTKWKWDKEDEKENYNISYYAHGKIKKALNKPKSHLWSIALERQQIIDLIKNLQEMLDKKGEK
jgi:hypothetical protein